MKNQQQSVQPKILHLAKEYHKAIVFLIAEDGSQESQYVFFISVFA